MFDLDNKYWIVNIKDSAKHLSDEEFETMQGLIKKVDLLSKGSGQYFVTRLKG